MSEADPPPLRENPTVAQMKAYEEEKLKKDKNLKILIVVLEPAFG